MKIKAYYFIGLLMSLFLSDSMFASAFGLYDYAPYSGGVYAPYAADDSEEADDSSVYDAFNDSSMESVDDQLPEEEVAPVATEEKQKAQQ